MDKISKKMFNNKQETYLLLQYNLELKHIHTIYSKLAHNQ